MDGSLILIGFGASLAAGLATGAGALPLMVFRTLSPRVENALLGFSAGVMLAAAFFSLILPGLEAARDQGATNPQAALIIVAGILAGAAALAFINAHAPHEHFIRGRQGADAIGLRRIWLFVIAITLHNFPEGLAVGVGFGGGDVANGTTLAIGIGLQNMPEGLAVAAALASQGYRRSEALRIATLTGLVEPVGGLIGITAVSLAQPLLPWSLAFAAGAMIFVVSDEIIPETHRKGYESRATLGLMIGLVMMMFLDVTLG